MLNFNGPRELTQKVESGMVLHSVHHNNVGSVEKCNFKSNFELKKCMLNPKLKHFQIKGKTDIAKMDFLYNSTILLKKNDFTHLINQNLNLHHVHILISSLNRKTIFEFKLLIFTKNNCFEILP